MEEVKFPINYYFDCDIQGSKLSCRQFTAVQELFLLQIIYFYFFSCKFNYHSATAESYLLWYSVFTTYSGCYYRFPAIIRAIDR